jgi:hypothetical protein
VLHARARLFKIYVRPSFFYALLREPAARGKSENGKKNKIIFRVFAGPPLYKIDQKFKKKLFLSLFRPPPRRFEKIKDDFFKYEITSPIFHRPESTPRSGHGKSHSHQPHSRLIAI